MQTTRRNFFKTLGILIGVAVLNPIKICQAIRKVKVSQNKDVTLIGTGKIDSLAVYNDKIKEFAITEDKLNNNRLKKGSNIHYWPTSQSLKRGDKLIYDGELIEIIGGYKA